MRTALSAALAGRSSEGMFGPSAGSGLVPSVQAVPEWVTPPASAMSFTGRKHERCYSRFCDSGASTLTQLRSRICRRLTGSAGAVYTTDMLAPGAQSLRDAASYR